MSPYEQIHQEIEEAIAEMALDLGAPADDIAADIAECILIQHNSLAERADVLRLAEYYGVPCRVESILTGVPIAELASRHDDW